MDQVGLQEDMEAHMDLPEHQSHARTELLCVLFPSCYYDC